MSYYDGTVRIPNRQLMEKFEQVLANDSMGEVKVIVEQSKEMLSATLDGNEAKVAAILENVHDREIPAIVLELKTGSSCDEAILDRIG